jgi:hypothetical protein
MLADFYQAAALTAQEQSQLVAQLDPINWHPQVPHSCGLMESKDMQPI